MPPPSTTVPPRAVSRVITVMFRSSTRCASNWPPVRAKIPKRPICGTQGTTTVPNTLVLSTSTVRLPSAVSVMETGT